MNTSTGTDTILLNAREAAKLLSISPRTLWRLTHEVEPHERMPYLRIGRALRYRREDLDQWAAKRAGRF